MPCFGWKACRPPPVPLVTRPGLLLLHKPVGPTSATLVREVAAAAGKLPLCHAGTLDPFACGLLIIAVGQATRAVDLVHDVPKEYVAEVAWGTETDNGDHLGTVVGSRISIRVNGIGQGLGQYPDIAGPVPV